jgi:hypothetical protein
MKVSGLAGFLHCGNLSGLRCQFRRSMQHHLLL